MPIGLEEEQVWRVSDRILMERLESEEEQWVTPPQIRSILDSPSYVEASMEYMDRVGSELPVGTWALVPAVRHLRGWISMEKDRRQRVLQCHPERILMRLNGQKIYQHPGTRRGLRHRLDLLDSLDVHWGELFRETKEVYRRNEIEELEILKLLTLAYAASRIVQGEGVTLPEDGAVDPQGFAMTIVDL